MKKLSDLKNVGKATLKDLGLLGINTVEELALQDATFLFQKLELLTNHRQDPCVWDVFASEGVIKFISVDNEFFSGSFKLRSSLVSTSRYKVRRPL